MRKPEIVREWYQVVDGDGYNVGSEHLQLSAAAFFMNKCLPKRRRAGCVIMHYVSYRIIVDPVIYEYQAPASPFLDGPDFNREDAPY